MIEFITLKNFRDYYASKKNLELMCNLRKLIEEVLKNLDNVYGTERDKDSDGGKVVILENKEELEYLKKLPVAEVVKYWWHTVEYSESPERTKKKVRTEKVRTFIESFHVITNDFAITLITPASLISDKDYEKIELAKV
jgi:hypothetical protein